MFFSKIPNSFTLKTVNVHNPTKYTATSIDRNRLHQDLPYNLMLIVIRNLFQSLKIALNGLITSEIEKF